MIYTNTIQYNGHTNYYLYPQLNYKEQHQSIFQDEDHLLSKMKAEAIGKHRKGKRLLFSYLSQERTGLIVCLSGTKCAP